MPRRALLDYVRRHYTASNVVIAAAGNLKHDELIKLIKKKFKFPTAATPKFLPAEPPTERAVHFVHKSIEQNHFTLAYPSVSFSDPLKFATLGMNFYLGGGMSSVLFQEIREKRGLAYSVFSFQDFYRDSGAFGIYLSTDGNSLPLALDLIDKQVRKLKKRPLPESQLKKIRAQIKGSLTFSMESATGRMNRLARHELMLGKRTPIKKSFAQVDALKPSDIQEAARLIFDEKLMVAVSLGPVTEKDLGDVSLN